MIYERGSSNRKITTEYYWLPSPEVRPICVTGVTAMYAQESHLSVFLPHPPDLLPSPNISSINLVCFRRGHRAFETFCFKLSPHRCPSATRSSVAAQPHLATFAHPNTTHNTKNYYLAIMSFVARNKPSKGDDHRSRSSLYEDDNADQHEEYQSTRSELPAEIPDSQPDPYLPSEIPDSQPDLFYEKDLPFGDLDYSEVSSQLPIGDHGDLRLGDASAFDLADYDLGDEGVVGPSDCSPNGQENIVSRVNRFDRLPRRQVGDSVLNQAFISSSTVDTEIIPGGTRLTERLKDRVVSIRHHPPRSNNLLLVRLESSRPHKCCVMY